MALLFLVPTPHIGLDLVAALLVMWLFVESLVEERGRRVAADTKKLWLLYDVQEFSSPITVFDGSCENYY